MKRLFSLVIIFVLFTQFTKAQDNPDALAYIERFKQLAMDEQNRVGLPASITLAQGLYESANGTSYLAKDGNNHFGIKCKKEWKGETILHTDDAPNECFRKYPSAEESYIDHSNYLKNNRRYAFLFDLDKNDFEGWAVGLKKAGYATNPQYAYKLIDLIKKYNLHQYTVIATRSTNIDNKNIEQIEKGIEDNKEYTSEPIQEKANDDNSRKIKNTPTEDLGYSIKNNLKGFYVKKGESLLEHATKRNIRYTKLLLINDLNDGPASEDMFVYVEKKAKIGVRPYHIVKEGETMIGIAQSEGIQLSALRTMNLLETDEMPKTGEALNLVEARTSKPSLVSISMSTPPVEKTVINEDAPIKTEDKNIAEGLFSKKEKAKDVERTEEKTQPTKNKITGEDIASSTIIDDTKKVEETRIIDNKEPEVVEETIIDTETKIKDEPVIAQKTQEPALPVILKSPSTYKEEGLSPDIRKLKEIIDKMVYAPLPQPKAKVETPKTIAPKDNKTTISTKPTDKNKTTDKTKTETPTSPKIIAAPAKAKTEIKVDTKKIEPKIENKIADIPQTKKPSSPKIIASPAKAKIDTKVETKKVETTVEKATTAPTNKSITTPPVKKGAKQVLINNQKK